MLSWIDNRESQTITLKRQRKIQKKKKKKKKREICEGLRLDLEII